MLKPPEKVEGMRLAVLKDRALLVTCECGYACRIPGGRLMGYFDPETRLRDVFPRLLCTECGAKGVQSYRLI